MPGINPTGTTIWCSEGDSPAKRKTMGIRVASKDAGEIQSSIAGKPRSNFA